MRNLPSQGFYFSAAVITACMASKISDSINVYTRFRRLQETLVPFFALPGSALTNDVTQEAVRRSYQIFHAFSSPTLLQFGCGFRVLAEVEKSAGGHDLMGMMIQLRVAPVPRTWEQGMQIPKIQLVQITPEKSACRKQFLLELSTVANRRGC